MTIRKILIFSEAWECGHRHYGICEHPDRPGTERICPSGIALWCPLPDDSKPEQFAQQKDSVDTESKCKWSVRTNRKCRIEKYVPGVMFLLHECNGQHNNFRKFELCFFAITTILPLARRLLKTIQILLLGVRFVKLRTVQEGSPPIDFEEVLVVRKPRNWNYSIDITGLKW